MTELNALFDSQRAHKRNTATEAASLLAMWQRLRSTHLPVSFGCSCGTMGHVRAEDFERDVLDYLRDKYSRSETITALLKRLVGDDKGSIGLLLQGLAAELGSDSAAERQKLTADLKHSISSWAAALGPA